MARHRDARSPSPVGSSYSAAKRSRRDDDYSDRRKRDDDRSYRRRSRSRSPDRRYRDRDSHRTRDRSNDRRDRDHYRHRESSRERRRSRDRDVRDYRDRSRDRHYRRESSRDRDRRRRDDSADSKKGGRRRESRPRGPARPSDTKTEPQKSSTAAAADEEKKKAERLAKLEAWKQKQQKAAAEKQKETETVTTAAGTRSLLDQIDKKAAASPAVPSSPQSPATPATSVTPSSPTPYAGKFDPKAIAKKAATNAPQAGSKLGTDVMLPGQNKPSLSSTSVSTGIKANTLGAPAKPSSGSSSVPLKARGNLSGFGIAGKSAMEVEKSTKKGLAFEEEEGSRMKLEKLPTPPLENGTIDEDTTLANGTKEDEDDDDDVDMEGGTEEEAAAAARLAAEKREERLQAQNLAYQAGDSSEPVMNGDSVADGDVTMTDVPAEVVVQPELEEEDEVDPLDAFMTDLKDMSRFGTAKIAMKKKVTQEPQAIFGDEDEVDMTVPDGDDDVLAITSKKKKKDIPAVDHAKMKYESFQKAFYVEPSDLTDLTEEDVADLRLELDGIKVRGLNVPKPAVKWSQCGLSNQIQDVISDLNFERPSSIQSQAIPAVMSGRDVISIAKTGSGKTIAFLLPMFRHIKAQPQLANMDGPIGLVMAPTRELATQIHRDCKPFLKALNLRAVCAYGGAPIKDQIAQLKSGAHIVVCTPGRMIDLLAANSGRVTNLRRVTYVVLDEADRMFDMGFEPQVLKILTNVRPDRQTVLFSATLNTKMEALAKKTLTKPIEITVGGRSKVAPEITQVVEIREEDTKFVRVLELLGNLYADEKNDDDRVLIFVERHEAADRLLDKLLFKGYPCQSIHGGKDQFDRNSAIDDFKGGAAPILIATSIAARGLDVKQLKLVINYDAPNHLEDYVHRAGRTGRAGNTGTAVTFVTPEQDRFCVYISKALIESGQSVPQDVQDLADGFHEKVKSGKEKATGSGFGGKGLERLDQERDATRNRERRAYKTGDEPDEEEKEEEKKGDELFKNAASAVQSSSGTAQLPGVPKGIDLDGKITVHKSEPAPSAAKSSKNPLDQVSQAVARISERLHGSGVPQAGAPIDNKGPDAGAYHATLEINDFPQKARWAVTNRTNVAKILDSTGTSITTKGSFYATGKEPQPGENPKLYILVEGDTELVVTGAMRELMRLLKEGTIAAADSESRAPASGRYSVV